MRPVAVVLVLVLLATVGLSGCETAQEHPRTAIGAGAGALGGAVLGGLIGRNTTGVVVGGLLGALAGGAIGYYLDRQDATREQAARATKYDPGQGLLVRVEAAQASPAAVRAGETVSLVVTYTLLTPRADQLLSVRETREIRHDGLLVANPTTEFTRANGTFTSALPITLPKDAAAGPYEVTVTVAAGDRISRGVTTFGVN